MGTVDADYQRQRQQTVIPKADALKKLLPHDPSGDQVETDPLAFGGTVTNDVWMGTTFAFTPAAASGVAGPLRRPSSVYERHNLTR